MTRLVPLFAVLFLGMSSSRIASAEETSHKGGAELISKENSVDSSRPPAEWRPATVGQELIVHDRLVARDADWARRMAREAAEDGGGGIENPVAYAV